MSDKRHYYLVRTPEHFVSKGLVGVGWSELNFSKYSEVEQLIKEIDSSYGVGRRANQIRRFHSINEGDVILVPLPYRVAIGVAHGGILYDKALYKEDRANLRQVQFERDAAGNPITILREQLTEALQRRINVRGMTVNELSEFDTEIEELLKNQESGTSFDHANKSKSKHLELEKQFKEELLGRIQSGKTYLRTGGSGLEHLVKELLECEGYEEVHVMSKRAYASFADADVKGIKSDLFTSRTLLIQVKHHQGISGEWGIDQLDELKRLSNPEDPDFDLAFLTSASVSEALLERANNNNIRVLDGSALVDWIYTHLPRLAPGTKARLGICEVPSLL